MRNRSTTAILSGVGGGAGWGFALLTIGLILNLSLVIMIIAYTAIGCLMVIAGMYFGIGRAVDQRRCYLLIACGWAVSSAALCFCCYLVWRAGGLD